MKLSRWHADEAAGRQTRADTGISYGCH